VEYREEVEKRTFHHKGTKDTKIPRAKRLKYSGSSDARSCEIGLALPAERTWCPSCLCGAKVSFSLEAHAVTYLQTPSASSLRERRAPVAYRKNLSGVLDTARLVLWNIEKK
jgi:hypothetical protein